MIFGLCAGVIAAAASAQPGVEREILLPAFPRQDGLIEFYVSAIASNRFFIDATSLSVAPDGEVRYVLVVNMAGGATNISFEGMRCGSGEYKLFATGRSDGTWARARTDDWRTIEDKLVNRHHAALKREFFCPEGIPLANAAEGVDALRRGKHPRAQ